MKRCPTCGRREKRSSDANRRYWALLAKLSDGLRPDGRQFPPNAYHLYYKQKFMGCDDVEMPNGQVMTVPRSTADTDTPEFADYVTKVEADAAERGIYLED